MSVFFVCIFSKCDRKSPNTLFVNFAAPWQGLFADAGDVDGDGGGEIGTNICSINHPI